jgi:hypothetical protein
MMSGGMQGVLAQSSECADCGTRGADWAVINLGIVVCISCSGVHRSLGVHISKVSLGVHISKVLAIPFNALCDALCDALRSLCNPFFCVFLQRWWWLRSLCRCRCLSLPLSERCFFIITYLIWSVL